jgi:hypothetical protein
MHAALTRPVALGALVVLGACSSMQRVPVNYINDQKPEVVHLANSYGIVTTLQNPTLHGDTVYGVLLGENKSVGVPLGQVESISTVRSSTGRTVALVAGATGVTALIAYAMFTNADNDEDWYCDWGNNPGAVNEGSSPMCGPRRP